MPIYRIVENGKVEGEIGAQIHLYDLFINGVAIERNINYNIALGKVKVKIMPGDVYQEVAINNPPVEINYDVFMVDIC